MYVAVKGGERAILNSHKAVEEARRGDPALPEIEVAQIAGQLGLAVDRVMAEGSLYDRELAALAIKQAQGDLNEAAFLVRACRATLPRFAASLPIDTARMLIRRRISAAFKDLPGGQVLGPTYDYTHRLMDFSLLDASAERAQAPPAPEPLPETMPRVTDIVGEEGLLSPEPADDAAPFDVTRQPMEFPAGRDQRLQVLARGDEGFLLGLAYSSVRGYGQTHPFVGEIRLGEVPVEIAPEELGFAVEIGDVTVTECQMITQFTGSMSEPPQFTRGYGLAFGHSERKAMSMAIVDRALRAEDHGEEARHPAQTQEFVLYHADPVEAAGFVSHFKLPHYVDFQSELDLLRKMRREIGKRAGAAEEGREAAE